MSWNYRVIKDKNDWYGICEVYYNAAGQPLSWSEPSSIQGESLDELRNDIIRLRVALELPVLVETDNNTLVEER